MAESKTNKQIDMHVLLSGVRWFAFLVYGFSIYYQQTVISPAAKTVFGKFKFLTYWDLLLQFGFFALMLFGDSLLKLKSKTFVNFMDFLLFSLVYPIATSVSISFWSLYAIDREIIFPVAIEKFYPVWLNHSTHTLVFILALAELYYGNHSPPAKRSALIVLNLFSLTYAALVLYIALTHNLWVYPFLELLDWPQRFIFIAAVTLFNSAIFYSGIVLNNLNPAKKFKKKYN